MDIQTINLPNGRTAVSFVPEDSKELAIVHLSTIKKLASLLPKASEAEIIQELRERLANSVYQAEALNRKGESLKDAIEVCNEFTAFHETVNLIEKYDPDIALKGVDAQNQLDALLRKTE